jgi:hypothetical protein
MNRAKPDTLGGLLPWLCPDCRTELGKGALPQAEAIKRWQRHKCSKSAGRNVVDAFEVPVVRGKAPLAKTVDATGRRDCSCRGNNENCRFCYGSGVIEGKTQNSSLVPKLGVVEKSGRGNIAFGKSHFISKLPTQVDVSSEASFGTGASVETRSIGKKRKKRNKGPRSKAKAKGLPKSSQTSSQSKTSSSRERRNPIHEERLSSSLDATKDYAHNFREQGRFGSHPSHDDYDEGPF